MHGLCYKYLMFVFSNLAISSHMVLLLGLDLESTYPRKGMQINS